MNAPKPVKPDFADIVTVEKSLLGTMIVNPACIPEVASVVTPSDFYDPQFSKAFRRMADMSASTYAVTVESVIAALIGSGFSSDGARDFVLDLRDMGGVTSYPLFASQIRDASRRRELFKLKDVCQQLADDHRFTPDMAIARMQAAIDGVSAGGSVGFCKMSDAFNEFLDGIGQEQQPGIETGIPGIDVEVSALQPGQLVVIAARPSLGKSALAQNIASHNARNGKNVLFVSLEMPPEEIVIREIAARTKISTSALASEGIPDDLRRKLTSPEVLQPFADMGLYIADAPGATVEQIRGLSRLLESQSGIDLLIVDYLQLVTSSVSGRSTNDEVSAISRALKRLARELRIPVIALSQLNRVGEGGKPKLVHLRDSGAIEQDADRVWFIYDDQEGQKRISIAKQRNGPRGFEIPVTFNGSFCTFETVETAESWEP